MPSRTPLLAASLAMLAALAGCYRSHGRESADAGTRDAASLDAFRVDAFGVDAFRVDAFGVDAFAVDAFGVDAPIEDAGVDAGPARMLRWVPLAERSAEVPPARYAHFAVYDAVRDRMLVLGGFDPYDRLGRCCLPDYIYHRDLWSLDLESEEWSLVAELAEPLVGAHAVSASLDAPRRRIVLIGAQRAWDAGPRNLAVDLDTFVISSLPDGPWPRPSVPLRAAHDPGAQRIVVHGAYWTERTEAVWMLDLTSERWSALDAAEPPPLRFHAPLIAGVRPGSMLLFGGYDGDRGHADLWELDIARARWAAVPLSDELPGRYSHRAIAEPLRGLIVAFGGGRSDTHDRTVLIDRATGSAEEPELDPRPPGRRDATMVLDSRRRRALLFGGAFESSRAYSDTWALELP